jgi:single-stranded DNA-specific DHH superfamily exonuclease
MNFIDVFNGDADGICALHQLRLTRPLVSKLVTGVKRDISLLKKVEADRDDTVTVLDISLDKNRDELLKLLDKGVNVLYFDHHFAGEIPQNDRLESYIDTNANMCTSLLVNKYLNNKYLAWAVTAAYGDNLFVAAENAAKPLKLATEELEQLKLLGTCINYNGYGSSLDDLIFTPEDLYKKIKPYADPFDFINNEPAYQTLVNGYREDMANANAVQAEYESDSHALFILENEKWAKRVSGVLANQLAQENPNRAHAMLTKNDDNSFIVSVRAPLNNKTGADELCRQFATGGGRKAAAGINNLPATDYEHFLSVFLKYFKN